FQSVILRRSEANDFAFRGGWTRAQPKDLAVFIANVRSGFGPLRAKPVCRSARARLSGPIVLSVEATQVFDPGSPLRRALTASQRNNCRAQHLAFAQDDGREKRDFRRSLLKRVRRVSHRKSLE
ncbi:MAG: hypothetical protein LV480_12620, partial [Methylacidiphilales bacterium]|nr:hypothetical protein [Candidatus Methylacidiphilales bacterium]